MSEVEFLDIRNYKLSDFTVPPTSVKPHEFMDKGQKNVYHTFNLLYKGKPFYILVGGISYGIGAKNKKGDEESAPGSAIPGMVSISQAPANANNNNAGSEEEKAEKYQIAFQLTDKPAPNNWTPEEVEMINFLSDGIRQILGDALARETNVINQINPTILADAAKQLKSETTDPANAGKFVTDEARFARFKEITKSVIMGKATKKVYRKKNKAAPGAESNAMSFMDENASYDISSFPSCYGDVVMYKKKGSDVVDHKTKYYKSVEGLPEDDWPEMTFDELMAIKGFKGEGGLRLDTVFAGANGVISIQSKWGEIVYEKSVAMGGFGHSGRMVRARGPVVRDPALRAASTAITAGADGKNVLVQQPMMAPPMQQQMSAPVFDPTQIPGLPPSFNGGVSVTGFPQ